LTASGTVIAPICPFRRASSFPPIDVAVLIHFGPDGPVVSQRQRIAQVDELRGRLFQQREDITAIDGFEQRLPQDALGIGAEQHRHP
jgi:hypothetical protein